MYRKFYSINTGEPTIIAYFVIKIMPFIAYMIKRTKTEKL